MHFYYNVSYLSTEEKILAAEFHVFKLRPKASTSSEIIPSSHVIEVRIFPSLSSHVVEVRIFPPPSSCVIEIRIFPPPYSRVIEVRIFPSPSSHVIEVRTFRFPSSHVRGKGIPI